jgi:hypothetical protein
VWYFGATLPLRVRQVLPAGTFTGGAVELFDGGGRFGESGSRTPDASLTPTETMLDQQKSSDHVRLSYGY